LTVCLVVSLATQAFAMANFKQSGTIDGGILTMTLSFDVPTDGDIRLFTAFISFDADVLALYDGSAAIELASGEKIDNVENTAPYNPLEPFALGGAVVALDNFVYANTRLVRVADRYLLDLGFFAFEDGDVSQSEGTACVEVKFEVSGDLDHTSIRFADEALDADVLVAMAPNGLEKRASLVTWIEGGASKYLVHKSFAADINYGDEDSMLKDLVYPDRYRFGYISDPDRPDAQKPSGAEALEVLLASLKLGTPIGELTNPLGNLYREEQVRSMNPAGVYELPSGANALAILLISLQ